MSHASAVRRWSALVAISVSILFIWLIILPWISDRPAMKQHLSELDRQGIDGGAMYYTELEVMDRILDKIER
ncbi:MAG: hypothetical protein AAGI63_13410 [Planctomycetota bacterium]